MTMEAFSPNVFRAFIPGKFIEGSSNPLYLDSTGLNLVTHSDPYNAVAPYYDIELEINHLITDIFPLIDKDAVGLGRDMTVFDLYHAYCYFFAFSNRDFSAEEELELDIEVPPLPLAVSVEKTVQCGTCDAPGQSSRPGDKMAWSLRDGELKFFVTITVPLDNPGFPANGMGYVFGKDLLTEIDDAVLDGSLEQCANEITLNGQTGIVAVPDFNVEGETWFIADATDPNKPYLFNPSDPSVQEDFVVVIPFSLKANPTFDTKGITQDILNTVEVWGFNGVEEGDHNTSSARVNLLIPELYCYKEVSAPGHPWDPTKGGIEILNSELPIEITWKLCIQNTGETYMYLGEGSIIDDCICAISDLTGNPFCLPGYNPDKELAFGETFCLEIPWTIDNYAEYVAAIAALSSISKCANPDGVQNIFEVTGSAVTEGEFPPGSGQNFYICHEESETAYCESNTATIKFASGPHLKISVNKTVSCMPYDSFSPELAKVLPGSEVEFTLEVTNDGILGHEHTWFSDLLDCPEIVYIPNSFKIVTAGFDYLPKPFKTDDSLFELIPPLQAGETVVMTFRALVDPSYAAMGVNPECVNALNGYADGPDVDPDPDVFDVDDAAVDILVPSIYCEKKVKVVTDNGTGTVYGPAAMIPYIAGDEPYPWKVTWTINVYNDGETRLTGQVSDPFLDIPKTACNFPMSFDLLPGQALPQIVCNLNVDDIYENIFLDGIDSTGIADNWITNIAELTGVTVYTDLGGGKSICYTLNGMPVDAYTPTVDPCSAWYPLPDNPCGEIALEKKVSCFEAGPYAASAEGVPGAWIFFKIKVSNPSATVPLENAYITDELYGDGYQNFTPIDPPDFTLGTRYNLGPLNPGEYRNVFYKVQIDPNFNTMGNPLDFWNGALAEGDGPDAGAEPDYIPPDCLSAQATAQADVNIVIPDLCLDKIATVVDKNGQTWGPDTNIDLSDPNPNPCEFPIDIYYTVTVDNCGEVDLPSVDISDQLLQDICNGLFADVTIDCGVWGCPPWNTALAKDAIFEPLCVVRVNTVDAANMLAAHDFKPSDTERIDNRATCIQAAGFDLGNICGDGPGLEDFGEVHIYISEPKEPIPALDWRGITLLILALGGLIIWRTMKNS